MQIHISLTKEAGVSWLFHMIKGFAFRAERCWKMLNAACKQSGRFRSWIVLFRSIQKRQKLAGHGTRPQHWTKWPREKEWTSWSGKSKNSCQEQYNTLISGQKPCKIFRTWWKATKYVKALPHRECLNRLQIFKATSICRSLNECKSPNSAHADMHRHWCSLSN